MKKLLIISIYSIAITSCSVDKTKIVEKVIQNINSKNYKQLRDNLVDDFEYIRFNDDSIYSKDYFIEIFSKPSIKDNNFREEILDLMETDSTVITLEKHYRPIDTILQVQNLTETKKTYYFTGEKISRIIIDTILNEGKYEEEFIKLINPANSYIEDKYGKELEKLEDNDRSDYLFKNILAFLMEYSRLTEKEKNEYKIRSYLKGTFISNDNPFYKKLEFKGRSTVIIYDPYIGFGFPTSYVIDENFIRIRTDKSDLLLEIKDDKTLIGEGWAKGTFIKK